jgi:hypothetical protein
MFLNNLFFNETQIRTGNQSLRPSPKLASIQVMQYACRTGLKTHASLEG